MIVLIFLLLFFILFFYQSYLFIKEKKLIKLIQTVREKIIFKKLVVVSIIYTVAEVIASLVIIIYTIITIGYKGLSQPNAIIHIMFWEISSGPLLIAIITFLKCYMIFDFIIDQTSFFFLLVGYYILHSINIITQIFSFDFKVTLLRTWFSFNYHGYLEVGINIFSLVILFSIIVERNGHKRKFFDNFIRK